MIDIYIRRNGDAWLTVNIILELIYDIFSIERQNVSNDIPEYGYAMGILQTQCLSLMPKWRIGPIHVFT